MSWPMAEKSFVNEFTLSVAADGFAVVAGVVVVAVVDFLAEEHAAPATLKVKASVTPPTVVNRLFRTPSSSCKAPLGRGVTFDTKPAVVGTAGVIVIPDRRSLIGAKDPR